MEQKTKIKLAIDGKEIEVEEGATVLETARQNDIEIPTLCYHPALSNWGGCRLCVVEVDGSPKLVASCVMPVREGMEVVTSNERIINARRTVLEFIFSERNHFCMFCAQSGDCELQSLAYELQMDHLTVPQSFEEFPTDITNEYMAIDHSRCVLCGRCVRACHEIAGAFVINFQNRGPESLIGFDFNASKGESTCLNCGVCMQVCPTGAIYSRYRAHYAVKGHKKEDWEIVESFCPQCGLMCETVTTVVNNNIVKIEGKLQDDASRPDHGQLCYAGRFEPLKSNGKRLLKPMVKGANGTWEEESWDITLDLLAKKMNSIAKDGKGEGVFGLVSSRCSNEELMLFRDLMAKGWAGGFTDTLDGSYHRTIYDASRANGNSLNEASWKLIPESDCLIVVSADPGRSQPVISSLLRRTVLENGVKLIVIGQEDTLSPWSSYFIPVGKGNEAQLLKALWAETVNSIVPPDHIKYWKAVSDEAEGVSVSELIQNCGLSEVAAQDFHEAAKVYAASSNPMLIAGEDLIDHNESSGLKEVMKLAKLKDLLPGETLRLIILKPNGNSSGAWTLKLASNNKANGDKWRGGMILLGDEDISGSEFIDSIDELEFLAVVSPYFPEALADKAHILIPKPLSMEENGSYTSLDGLAVCLKKKILQAPEGVKETWQTMMELTNRTDFNPDYSTWTELVRKALDEMKSLFPNRT